MKSSTTAWEGLRSQEGWEWRLDSQGPISLWSPHRPKKIKKNGIIPLIRSGREDTCLGHKTDGAAQEAQLETALALELVLGKGILLQGKS